MVDSFIICSFYTPDYKGVFETYLKPSLDRLNLDYYSKEYPNKGEWTKNTRLKSNFSMECLERFPDKNIIVLDADSRINVYPELLGIIPHHYDVAAHLLDHNRWYRNGSDKKEFLTGTLFFRNNLVSHSIVKEWVFRCESSMLNDQDILEGVLKSYNIPVFNLPLGYCYIVSLPDGGKPFIEVDRPIIEHFQHSRVIKRAL